jgi:hypothetical protein
VLLTGRGIEVGTDAGGDPLAREIAGLFLQRILDAEEQDGRRTGPWSPSNW